MKTIFLIGMMGVGKTTVGKKLARRLNMEFHDLDEKIEKYAGKSIPEIFHQDGEAKFRRLEEEMTRHHCLDSPQVISVGGGFPLNPVNRQWMRSHGYVIWLRAEAETILQRVRGSNRPMLEGKNGLSVIRTFLDERDIVYRSADEYISTDRRTPDEIVCDILKKADHAESKSKS